MDGDAPPGRSEWYDRQIGLGVMLRWGDGGGIHFPRKNGLTGASITEHSRGALVLCVSGMKQCE